MNGASTGRSSSAASRGSIRLRDRAPDPIDPLARKKSGLTAQTGEGTLASAVVVTGWARANTCTGSKLERRRARGCPRRRLRGGGFRVTSQEHAQEQNAAYLA